MKRIDRIKLNFTRNWKFSGKERLCALFKISREQKARMQGAITWLEDEDIAIYADTESYIEWTILSGGTYENEIGKLIRLSLMPGDGALDIGTNIGLQSMRMARAVTTTGLVYGFEPLDHLRAKAERNIKLNMLRNVTIFPFALADMAAEEDFAIDKNSWNQGAFSLVGNSAGNESQKVVIKVADDIDEVRSMEKLKLIKIDVEGFEFNVLKGLRQTLTRHKPRLIFEYDENYWSRSLQHIDECYAYLTELGYTLYQITSVGCELIEKASGIQSGNIFCMQDK